MDQMAVSTDVAVVGFNYEALPAEDAQEARAAAKRVRGRMEASIIESGHDLAAVKERIGHGHFGAWLKAEFNMSERTAQNYMQAASAFGAVPEIVSVLPPTTVYALSAKSTPETIRADVIRQIEEGQRLEPAQINDALRQHKEQEAERVKAERQAAERAKLTPEQQAEHERKDKRRRQSRAQREESERRQKEEWAAKQAARERASEEAAALLAEQLGPYLDRFVALYDASGYGFRNALEAVSKRPKASSLPRSRTAGAAAP